jgi:hypothetical protein
VKRCALALLALGVAVTLPACKNRDQQIKELRAAITRTEHLANRFVYTVTTPDGTTDVRGIVEDDFRFKARVTMNNATAYDEVVNDDSLAVRFADPSRLAGFLSQEKPEAAQAPTDFTGVTVSQALNARRWVLDRQGAPAVAEAAAADARLGADPVLDALTVLDYIRRASNDAFGVKRFDPDSLDPVYRSSEDNFPKPQKGSGVARYDFERPFLPPVSAAGQGGESAFPQSKHFRRMAVYVKDGRIIDVREAIDLRGRGLTDFIKYERALLKEAKVPKAVLDEFDKLVVDTPAAQLATELLQFLNELLTSAGLSPINIRQMSLELRDLGTEQQVDLPDENVIRGSLAVLTLSRREKTDQKTGGGAGTTTSSTVATGAPVSAP